MGRLIGSHPRYATIPVEVRFHCEPMGLPDLLSGAVTVAEFLDRLRNHWYSRQAPDGRRRGFPGLIGRSDLEAALEGFSASFDRDPVAASRTLVSAVLDPVAERAGKESWVEMTPWTAARAATLFAMFPNGKFVHIVRDGRDVACSVSDFFWGPETALEAIPWWEGRLRDAELGTRPLPAERALVIELEDLVLRDRAVSYQRLLDFLSLEDHPDMRSFFEQQVTANRAHVGRWQEELLGRERMEVEQLYAEALAGLKRDAIAPAG